MSLANGLLLFFASVKFLLVFQQSGYRFNKYFEWVANAESTYLNRLMLLCLLGFLFFCVLSMSFLPIFGATIASYVGFVSYLLFTGMYIKSEHSINAKIKLKKTKRLVRLSITFVLFLSLVSFGLITLLSYLCYIIGDEALCVLRFALVCGMPILIPYILFLSYCFNEPFEEMRRRHYLFIAKNKLNKSNVIKIGITGSYAKTSVKEILNTILSQKYRVLASPESYNTPLGIALAVKSLDNLHDVFIAEMGARQTGDIKELTELVHPQIAILTGINNQHLETFGSIENIEDTKYELFENLEEGAKAFFSSDSSNSINLAGRFGGEKYLAGRNGDDNLVYATNVVTSELGTSFVLNIKGEKPVEVQTVLLGEHSVSNICLASAVAYKLGLSVDEIVMGINRIKSIGHRLELIPNNKGVVIIDDSYNSNEDGVKAAMQVLDMFEGRKIVLTPGLVELGKNENVANMEYGKLLSKHVDIVVIVGKHNAEMIISGLVEGGFNRENIYFERNVSRGNDTLNGLLKEGDVVLFENDLPDNYV